MTNEYKQENSPLQRTVTLTLKEWEAWRKAAGLHIDPETAEILWEYTEVVDPYGVWPDIPEECDCIGRSYFARSPGMGVWIAFGDLPEATRDALWQKHKSQFPAGLMDFYYFSQDYVERNFGPPPDLSDDEYDEAMTAAYQVYLFEKTGREEARDEPTGDR